MALYKQKIDKEPVKSLFPKPKSGYHKWIKRQMNKLLRRRPIEDDEVGYKTNRKPTKNQQKDKSISGNESKTYQEVKKDHRKL